MKRINHHLPWRKSSLFRRILWIELAQYNNPLWRWSGTPIKCPRRRPASHFDNEQSAYLYRMHSSTSSFSLSLPSYTGRKYYEFERGSNERTRGHVGEKMWTMGGNERVNRLWLLLAQWKQSSVHRQHVVTTFYIGHYRWQVKCFFHLCTYPHI